MSFYSMHNQRGGRRGLGVKGDRVCVKINTLNQQSASLFIEIYAVICGCLRVCGRSGAHSGPGASPLIAAT